MAEVRSFADYVKRNCEDKLIEEVGLFIENNWESLDFNTHLVDTVGEVRFSYANIQRVYVSDLPGSRVAFEVALECELELCDQNYRNDETDADYPWIRVYCEGDLSNGLEDWKINKIEPYAKKNAPLNSLSDALVPRMEKERFEEIANDFLEKFYPEALVIPGNGQSPTAVEPDLLAKRLGLNIIQRDIKEDASAFGQLFFDTAEVELYNSKLKKNELVSIQAKTILVDPNNAFLRNLGSQNNTIVHECVHWVYHRKVFELEKLYNKEATNISCEVVGNATSRAASAATKQMEYQANQLAPRIQMPSGPFKAKANEYIREFMKQNNTPYVADVMENVIKALETDFVVSRQAAKVRLVELGFDEAVGTYTYLDGHYVQPHTFKKGALKRNQTFSISEWDAAVQRVMNPKIKDLTDNGYLLFVDNHYVYNSPKYVQSTSTGSALTDYARNHMDECCLIFDMTITSNEAEYCRTACYLNRIDPKYTYEIKFNSGYENDFRGGQERLQHDVMKEAIDFAQTLPGDTETCFDMVLKWAETTEKDLAKMIGRDVKTITRIKKGESTTDYETAAAICFALRLPPPVSRKLIAALSVSFKSGDEKHQWIENELNVHWTEGIIPVKSHLKKLGIDL